MYIYSYHIMIPLILMHTHTHTHQGRDLDDDDDVIIEHDETNPDFKDEQQQPNVCGRNLLHS